MTDNRRVSPAQTGPQQHVAARRGSLSGWLAARLLRILSAVLVRLPPGVLHRAADALGGVLYRTQRRRRRLVRENLRRVVTYLAAGGPVSDEIARAARDERALEGLTRAAFGHYLRGYLEAATLPAHAREDRLARVQPDDRASYERCFQPDSPDDAARPMIIVGMHFGAIEIPALWATRRLGRPITAPMETVADPHLQAYFEATRRKTGLDVIPTEQAAPRLRQSLARGELVALVADRPVGGAGARVSLFGAPARLPIGPAVLALESGAPVWLIATRRLGRGEYRSRIEPIEMPGDGSRRERLGGFLEAQARAFERAVADAPEQWWTVFFQIWDDIRP